MTWMQPRRTSSLGESACTCAPSNRMAPFVTSPRSACSRFEIAFRVVVLPAPLAPSNATMWPRGTSSDTPLSTRMTWSYTTSMLLRDRIAALAGCVRAASWAATDTRPPYLSPRAGRGRASFALRIVRNSCSRRLVAGLGALRPSRILGHVVLGGGFQHRAHLVLHGRDPIGDLHPLGAVPLLHIGGLVAVVVTA